MLNNNDLNHHDGVADNGEVIHDDNAIPRPVRRGVFILTAVLIAGIIALYQTSLGRDMALMTAVYRGRADSVNAWLARGANASTALHYRLTARIFDPKTDAPRRDTTALMLAADGGHLDIVNALIKAGADINAKDQYGWTALIWAGGASNPEIIEALVRAGADVNYGTTYGGLTALEQAARSGSEENVRLLLKNGADVNAHHGSALRRAVGGGYAGCVEILLQAGADVNARSTSSESLHAGRTALMEVVSDANFTADVNDDLSITLGYERKLDIDNELKIMKMLLAAGADVNIRDAEGKTAMDLVTNNTFKEIALELFDAAELAREGEGTESIVFEEGE